MFPAAIDPVLKKYCGEAESVMAWNVGLTQSAPTPFVGVQVEVEDVKAIGMVEVIPLEVFVSPADVASKRQPALVLRRSTIFVPKEKWFNPVMAADVVTFASFVKARNPLPKLLEISIIQLADAPAGVLSTVIEFPQSPCGPVAAKAMRLLEAMAPTITALISKRSVPIFKIRIIKMLRSLLQFLHVELFIQLLENNPSLLLLLSYTPRKIVYAKA
jgi:hypothetical protein